MSLVSALARISKFLGTRNVRVPAKGLPKGMGITRRGTVTTLKGGQRVLNKAGGGTTFLKKSAKLGMTRGQKGGAYAVGGAAIYAAASQKPPSGPPTAGQKQFSAVKKGGFVSPFEGDIAKRSASGYHTFKKGSAGAKSFKIEYGRAKKGSKFYWPGTGKYYNKP